MVYHYAEDDIHPGRFRHPILVPEREVRSGVR